MIGTGLVVLVMGERDGSVAARIPEITDDAGRLRSEFATVRADFAAVGSRIERPDVMLEAIPAKLGVPPSAMPAPACASAEIAR